MGTVRCFGETFKINGDLLTAEEFEEWLEVEGQPLLEGTTNGLAYKWFRGEARSRRQLLRNASAAIENSDLLQKAIEARLCQLPEHVRQIATVIDECGPESLSDKRFADRVVAVPRVLVAREFAAFLVGELSEVAALRIYEGLAEVILQRTAFNAEADFATRFPGSGYPYSNEQEMLLEVNHDYAWRLGEPRGHYYYGRSAEKVGDLVTWRARDKFREQLTPSIRAVKDLVGTLSENDLTGIAEAFDLNGREPVGRDSTGLSVEPVLERG